MKILALNIGSSSLKYCLFDTEKEYAILASGSIDRIGEKGSSFPDHAAAIEALCAGQAHIFACVDAIGHRVIHGGQEFVCATLIDQTVIDRIAKLAKFAPLHSHASVVAIEIWRRLFPTIPQVAIFDTATHATIPPHAFLYGIPFHYYEMYKIRKYGFHGINHAYVAQEAARLLRKKVEDLKIITCHLGSGCSITAFKDGKSQDNSMGLTPLEGLVMGTRSGDIDPSIVLYLAEALSLSTQDIIELLNRKSGLLGLCGSNDMRDIIVRAMSGDQHAQMAIDVFVYRVQKYIGGYIAALNGIDALIFTGGIGENSPLIRARIVQNFTYMGAILEGGANERNEGIFSTPLSSLHLMNIAANEEKVIAEQTHQLLFKSMFTKA